MTDSAEMFSQRQFGSRWRSDSRLVVSTVAIGLVTDMLLYTIFVPVLPFLLRDRFGLTPNQAQDQVSNLLAVHAGTSVITSPIVGFFADSSGSRKWPFLMGVVCLSAATILLLLGQSIWIITIARALQGISASVVWGVGLAFCLETVGPRRMGKILGSIFGLISVTNLLAPILGGFLYEKAGLVGIASVIFTLLAVDFILRLVVLEKAGSSDNDHGDSPHGILDDEVEVPPPEVQPLVSSSDLPQEHFLYPLPTRESILFRQFPITACMRHPSLLAAFLLTLTQGILLGSLDATVPIISQKYYGLTPWHVGLMFLPLGVSNLVFGPILGICVDKFGTKRTAIALYSYLVPVLLSLRYARPGGSKDVYALILLFVGLGLAGTGAPSLVEASNIVFEYFRTDPEFFDKNGPFAQLFSLTNCFFQAGLTIGAQVAGRLSLAIGYGRMNGLLAMMCLFTAVVSYFFLGEQKRFLSRRRNV